MLPRLRSWSALCAIRLEAAPGAYHSRSAYLSVPNPEVGDVIGKWREGGPPRPENVKSAARAYGVDPLELMRVAYLSDGDGEATPVNKAPARKPSRVDLNGGPL